MNFMLSNYYILLPFCFPFSLLLPVKELKVSASGATKSRKKTTQKMESNSNLYEIVLHLLLDVLLFGVS